MQLIILLSCTVALASASWIPFLGHKEEHHPIIHDGVPLDTPEVQHARAEHLAAHAEASAHGGYYHHGGDDHHELVAPVDENHDGHHGFSYHVQHVYTPHHHEEYVHHGDYNHYHHEEPVIDHDGKPLDTPEVEKAKALHFAEVHKALARLHEHGYHHGLHRRDLGDFALEVDHAHNHGYVLHQNHAPVYGHQEEYHDYHHHEVPQIGHDGRPLDTAEVEHAKALHFAAHQEALARNQHAKHHGGVEFHHY